jgi:hypothetical protein
MLDKLRLLSLSEPRIPVSLERGVCQEQSAEVIGFTAGDLRGMYPEGVPDWIKSQYQGDFEQIPSEADLLF